ncbi:unnamed protein product, partial [marine sediment metagenome]
VAFRKAIALAFSRIEGGDVHEDENMLEIASELPQGTF